MKADYMKHIKFDQKFIAKIPSYSLYSILCRVAAVSIVGVLAMQFILFLVEPPPEIMDQQPRIKDYLLIIFTFNLLAESNIIVDLILEKYLPIPEKIRLRLAIHSFIGILLIEFRNPSNIYYLSGGPFRAINFLLINPAINTLVITVIHKYSLKGKFKLNPNYSFLVFLLAISVQFIL